jgi:hypothetical protein
MNQQRKNVKSTKPKEQVKTSATKENKPEVEPYITERMNLIYAEIYDTEGHTYTDPTGRFPSVSNRGYNNILVLYDFDTNSIFAEPVKNRSDSEAIRAYTVLYYKLTSKGLKPLFQTMDNKTSKVLKMLLTARNIKFQLLALHVHPQKAAERAIQMFKNHFLARICSTDKHFPLHLRDIIIPHAVLNINLLRQSRVNPKRVAYVQLNGPFEFNRTPVAPPVSRVIFHDNPRQRKLGRHTE